jgi:hypothetical protein
MRNGFLLSLGTIMVCIGLAPAQGEHNGIGLPSEQDIQVLPTIRIVTEINELPPVVVTRPPAAPSASLLPPSAVANPEKATATPAGPPTTATLAACCPPANIYSNDRLPRLRAFLQLLKYSWWKILHRD